VALLPPQSPDAVHDVALVADQFSVIDEPDTTDEALDVNVTVGAGGELPPPLPPHPASNDTQASMTAIHADCFTGTPFEYLFFLFAGNTEGLS
jgi:hypothetical protein